MGKPTNGGAGSESRPWTVKLYVATLMASSLLLLLPTVSARTEWWSYAPHVLLLLGVWVGSRIAWALTLAVDAFSFVMGLAIATAEGLILVGLLAVWIGLLLASPTQRWVGRRRALRLVQGLPAEWRARPMTLRLYVGASLAAILLSILGDRREVAPPAIFLTVASVLLLKMLWDGVAGVWWLSVIVYAGTAALSLSAALEQPEAWPGFVVTSAALTLLVHPSTRAWFNERIAARYA